MNLLLNCCCHRQQKPVLALGQTNNNMSNVNNINTIAWSHILVPLIPTTHQLLLATHPSINQMQTLLPENDSISWMLEQMEGGEGVMGCSTAHWLLSGIYEGS